MSNSLKDIVKKVIEESKSNITPGASKTPKPRKSAIVRFFSIIRKVVGKKRLGATGRQPKKSILKMNRTRVPSVKFKAKTSIASMKSKSGIKSKPFPKAKKQRKFKW